MAFEAARARDYYEESRPLIGLVHPRSRPSLWALIEIYRRLLARIERTNFDVLAKRIRVPTWEKLAILARAKSRCTLPELAARHPVARKIVDEELASRRIIQKKPAKAKSLVSGLSALTCMKNKITSDILKKAITSATTMFHGPRSICAT